MKRTSLFILLLGCSLSLFAQQLAQSVDELKEEAKGEGFSLMSTQEENGETAYLFINEEAGMAKVAYTRSGICVRLEYNLNGQGVDYMLAAIKLGEFSYNKEKDCYHKPNTLKRLKLLGIEHEYVIAFRKNEDAKDEYIVTEMAVTM